MIENKRARDEHDKEKVCGMGNVICLCVSTAGMKTAYAADKTISSVKLQIYTDLEPGDKIGDAAIDIDSTTHRAAVSQFPVPRTLSD